MRREFRKSYARLKLFFFVKPYTCYLDQDWAKVIILVFVKWPKCRRYWLCAFAHGGRKGSAIVDGFAIFSSSLLPPLLWEGWISLDIFIIAQDRNAAKGLKHSRPGSLRLRRAITCVHDQVKSVLPPLDYKAHLKNAGITVTIAPDWRGAIVGGQVPQFPHVLRERLPRKNETEKEIQIVTMSQQLFFR